MKDISIIIPFYNSSEYIGRCVDSLCGQTISEKLELVFVDDGSTDDSVSVIEKHIRDNNFEGPVKIIRQQKNLGVAAARKVGLDAVSSKYVLYCDSDDWQETDMCEKLLLSAEDGGFDIVVCDYKSVSEQGQATIYKCFQEEFLKGLLLSVCPGNLWNKLIRTSVLKDDRFVYPNANFCEDYAYNVQAVIYAGKIGYVEEPLYNYYRREGSLVHSRSMDAVMRRYREDLENFAIVMDVLERNNLLNILKEEVVVHKWKTKNAYREYRALWLKTFPELWHEILKNHYIPFRSKTAYFGRLIGFVR